MLIQIGFLGLAFVKFDAPFEDNESLVIEPILNLIIRITINLQSAMGCGASADNKTTLQTIPLSQIQNNSPQNPAVVTSSPPQQLEKTAKVQQKKSNAKQQPEKKDLKTSTNKEQTKPKTDSKTNLQNSTTDIRSSSTQKHPDSLSKTQHQAKGSQGELRSSSLSKSQSSSKINGGSAANKKAGNPQELQKMKLAESVIQQEEVRATQPREKEKTVKKIKSVKNNKELTDLIKIYGL